MSRIETHKATSEKNEHIENKLKRCFKNKMHVSLTAKTSSQCVSTLECISLYWYSAV